MIELLGGMGAALAGRVLAQRLARIEAADRDLGATLERAFEATARAFRDGEVVQARAERTPELPREAWADPERFRRLVRPTSPEDGPLSAPTRAWALTSHGYRIPWREPHARALREFQKDVAAVLVAGLGFDGLVARPALIAGAGWEVRERDGQVEGYAAGLAAEEAAWWVKSRMRPSLADLRATGVDRRIAALRASLLEDGPVSLSGLPSYVHALVSVLAEDPEAAAALRRIRYYVWSGLGLGPARPLLTERLAPGLRLADVALSTEGPLGLPTDQPGVYRLASRQALHLFVRLGDADEPEARLYGHELTVGETYRVWLTSTAGLVAWDNGDRIRVLRTRPLRFVYAAQDPDPGALGAALGTAAWRLCLGQPGLLLAEPTADVARARELLPIGTLVRTVPAGSIARAVLKLGVEGYPKVPWIHRSVTLQRRIEALAP